MRKVEIAIVCIGSGNIYNIITRNIGHFLPLEKFVFRASDDVDMHIQFTEMFNIMLLNLK